MPASRRHLKKWHPPPLLPVGPDEHEVGPFHASPADRVLKRLGKIGEATMGEILEGFGEDDQLAAGLAVGELVRRGRVVSRLAARGKRLPGIEMYRPFERG